MDKILAWVPLNFALMANPVNWFVVGVVVLFWGMALAALTSGMDDGTTP